MAVNSVHFLLCMFCLTNAAAAKAPCKDIDHQHSAWSKILAHVVDGGLVNYDTLAANPKALHGYLTALENACPADYSQWNAPQRLAFWLNAYNAYTLKLIVDHYPLKSIRSIGLAPGAPFRQSFIPLRVLNDKTMSLDDIEHQVIRKEYQEPRVHFALVCAAMSCPPLRHEAYRASALEAQLTDQARIFIGDESKNRFDSSTNTLHLSAIFKWFTDDFKGKAPSLQAYVATYWPKKDDAAVPKALPEAKITYLKYDWALNKTP